MARPITLRTPSSTASSKSRSPRRCGLGEQSENVTLITRKPRSSNASSKRRSSQRPPASAGSSAPGVQGLPGRARGEPREAGERNSIAHLLHTWRAFRRSLTQALVRLTWGFVVGLARIELATSSLSGMRSNRLSYSPRPVVQATGTDRQPARDGPGDWSPRPASRCPGRRRRRSVGGRRSGASASSSARRPPPRGRSCGSRRRGR